MLCAQNPFMISGRVLDAEGSAVVGLVVNISGQTFSPVVSNFQDTTLTDSQGNFSYSTGLTNPSGNVVVWLANCANVGGTLFDSATFVAQDSVVFFDFVWCENSCEALFQYNTSGLLANFQDFSTSYYAINRSTWNFGDGRTGQGNQVSHLYDLPGTYTACLQIRDTSGCTSTRCDTIVVESCQANFAWSNPFANELLLTAQPSNALNPEYNWNLGDGSLGTGAQLSHTYASPGTYQVSLVLRDSSTNCQDTLVQQVRIVGAQACVAEFLPVFLSRDSIFFQNNSLHSLPGGGGINFQWAFGDGNVSTDVNPVHRYQNPGDYLACLLMEDDFGCRDSFCMTIRVLPGPVCDPSFVFNPINNLTAAFSAIVIEEGSAYNWTLPDGTTYQSPSFFHTFERPGKYEICLRVTDSTGTCSDSLCQELTLLAEELCAVDFTWNVLDSQRVAFYSLASVANPSSSRINWDFGDGTGDNSFNPVHTYGSDGPWEVCLMVNDLSNNCIQEVCYSIDLGSTPPNAWEIRGWVYLGGLPSFDANVELFHDVQGQDFLEKYGEDSCSFEAYRLQNVLSGSYLVYAEEIEEEGFMPTYLGGSLYWQEATATIVNNRNVVNPRIELIRGMEVEGTASITGKVFEGLKLMDGPPLEKIVVLLLANDMERSPVRYKKTDQNGNYELVGLPVGTYWVQPEIPGIYVAPKKVVIGQEGAEIEGISFGIGQGFGFPASTEEVAEIGMAPNPADDFLEITGMESAHLRIFNGMGQLVFERRKIPHEKFRIATGEWPEGIYFLDWIEKGKAHQKRLMIRH